MAIGGSGVIISAEPATVLGKEYLARREWHSAKPAPLIKVRPAKQQVLNHTTCTRCMRPYRDPNFYPTGHYWTCTLLREQVLKYTACTQCMRPCRDPCFVPPGSARPIPFSGEQVLKHATYIRCRRPCQDPNFCPADFAMPTLSLGGCAVAGRLHSMQRALLKPHFPSHEVLRNLHPFQENMLSDTRSSQQCQPL